MRDGHNKWNPPPSRERKPTKGLWDGRKNDPYCMQCYYYRPLCRADQEGEPHFCAYILVTGEARGCPAGSGCTRIRLRQPGDPQPRYVG